MPMLREDDGGQQDAVPDVLDHVDDEFATTISMQLQPSVQRSLSRKMSEESIRTELCEGPIPDSPPLPPKSTTPEPPSHAVSDRAELIERIKRGESPTWVPNRHLESLFQQDKTPFPPRTPPPTSMSPGLLPPPTITPEKKDVSVAVFQPEIRLQEGLNIERPRSALHSGNFTPHELSPDEVEKEVKRSHHEHFQPPGNAPWIGTSPPRDFSPFNYGSAAINYRKEAFGTPGTPSISSSLSSSFVYKPPTSPLVQSEVNEDLDLTLPLNSINIASSSPRASPRRHTLNFGPSSFNNVPGRRQIPLRRESSHPYQAHQPRRSLNSTPVFSFAGSPPPPPTPWSARRPSVSSEASPLHHASLVGSYEESILKGRMSTTPSKPLEFIAQIGVLGLGKCKSSLRCPPHVTLPFSAVFYSYASTSHGRSKTDDGPSPYVGNIDLENGLTNSDEGQRAKRKLQTRYPERKPAAEEEPSVQDDAGELSEGNGSRNAAKQKRRSRSPKAPPGGRYRIPEKGQLQIIIKNQNKTAVKLFLVPYDLAGMEPGTKTFVRQRSYSAGPILEAKVPDIKPDANTLGTDRVTLRYLVHLHICCPSKGRYYLYKSIRVVFANRVPDGKEKLRNEITHPDPRFSPYKPVRVMHPPLINANVTGPGATLAAEQASRRRSVGFALGTQLAQHHQQQYPHPPPPPFNVSESLPTTGLQQPLPFTPSTLFTQQQQPYPKPPSSGEDLFPMSGVQMTGLAQPPSATKSTVAPNYDKLSKGDVGYGGNAYISSTSLSNGALLPGTSSAGLISQRLRSLGEQQQQSQPQLPSHQYPDTELA
ncbi:hypothetical protein QBC40DRAFT_163714 [Triangularia verruculosa]|uniref:Atos-like conserved domain-containing protein n=1 Tax=Triangularia verruculosa TaxID=2587418 RepID=A0AAN7AXG3_9PEZI|nr:hypothetical protein QBC40DRAFT_163714 [Triangularia verruculosa]